ncbi:glycosyltransferase family 4 protein, partial [Patescibacteria group bacterium]|nr:glycosyltransferase family 4 protein [Patescibacteria group bacterium]
LSNKAETQCFHPPFFLAYPPPPPGQLSLVQSSKPKDWDCKLRFEDYRYFLYVGNAYPHKNLKRLLLAFQKIKNTNKDLKLVFVGREDYFYKRLKINVHKMGFNKDVVFAGWVSNQELFYLYKNAIAAIVPSLMEGFGLPALEAMASGCLVLASDTPSLKEICKDAAIYFDPYDVNDLREKMRKVYLNDIYHLSEKKEKGLERAKAFSWRKMAEETLEVYNTLKRGLRN